MINVIRRVRVSKVAEKQLRKLPRHIVDNLMIWVAAVEEAASKKFGEFLATMMNR